MALFTGTRWLPRSSRSMRCLLSLRIFSSDSDTKDSSIVIPDGANVDKMTHTGQVWESDDYRRVRFIDKEKLVNERFAIDYIDEDPIIVVKDRNVIASGGGGALGHPKIFINLDRDEVAICGYSGRKFIQAKYYDAKKHGPCITYEEFLEEEAV